MPYKRLADRALIRNAALHGVRFGGADYLEQGCFFRSVFRDFYFYGRAQGDDVSLDLVLVQNDGDFEHIFKFRNSGLHHGLLVFRLVVFAVFGQIAKRSSLFDLLRDLFPFE